MDFQKMDFQKIFRNAVEVIQLKEPAMMAVASDPQATQVAWVMVVLGALATSLGVTFFPIHYGEIVIRPDLFWILQQTIFESIGMLVGLYGGGFVAEKWFHSKLSMEGFVRVMGHAAALGLLAIVPVLSIVCVWELVVMWRSCTRLGKMQAESTILFLIVLILFSGLLSSLGQFGLL
jgi:hypothetical protein